MPWRHTGEKDLILNLGTRWRWVLNFMHWYPVIRRQWAVDMFEEGKIACLCQDLNLDPPPPILVTILTTLSWLLCLLYIRLCLFFVHAQLASIKSSTPTGKKFFTFALFVYSMAMIKSRLLNQRSLASTIIGVIPKEPEQHLDISVSNKWFYLQSAWCRMKLAEVQNMISQWQIIGSCQIWVFHSVENLYC